MLSTSAFNAFLKTLEEPPAHAVFILATTEKHKVLPTILSRCQTYDFNRISVSDMVANLRSIASKEGVSIEDEALHVIAKKADGAMRDALTIFDQTVAFCGTSVKYEDVLRNLNVLDYEYTFKLVDAFLEADYKTALLTFDEILSKGFNALHFVLALSSHFRDLAVARTAGLESLMDLPASLKERYRAQASRCSLKFIYDALGITTQCEGAYKLASNPRLHIEFALMKLCFLRGVPEAPAPVAPDSPAVAPAAPVTAPERDVQRGEHSPKGSALLPELHDRPAAEAEVTITSPAAGPAEAPVARAVQGADESPSGNAPFTASATPAPTEPAPVAETPAPVDEAEEQRKRAAEERAAARKRAAAPGVSGLSLSGIMKEDAEKSAPLEDGGGEVPEDDAIKDKWSALVALYANRPRLANALSTACLGIAPTDGGKLLTFTVTNEAQKKWIAENLLRDLEGSFCKLLGTNKVRLAVEAEAVVREEKIYLPGDQAKDLMSRNEEVKNLVIDLGLDI